MELFSLIFNEWKNLCAKETDSNREDRRVIPAIVIILVMKIFLLSASLLIVINSIDSLWINYTLIFFLVVTLILEAVSASYLRLYKNVHGTKENIIHRTAFCRQLQQLCYEETRNFGLSTSQAYELIRNSAESMLTDCEKHIDKLTQTLSTSLSVTVIAITSSVIIGIIQASGYPAESAQFIIVFMILLFLFMLMSGNLISGAVDFMRYIHHDPSRDELKRFIRDIEFTMALTKNDC